MNLRGREARRVSQGSQRRISRILEDEYLPLYARVKAVNSLAAVRILSGHHHTPDRLWHTCLRHLVDVRSCSRASSSFAELRVSIFQYFCISPKEGIRRRRFVKRKCRCLRRLIEAKNGHCAVTRRLSAHTAGASRDYCDTAIVTVVKKRQGERSEGVTADKRWSMLGEEPVLRVVVRRSICIH